MTVNLKGTLIHLYRYKLVGRCGNIQQFSDDHFHFLSETKKKKRTIEKVLEREKRKDEVLAEERRLTGLDICSRI